MAAWGDDGHKVVALIAQHYLTPAAKKQVDVILAADTEFSNRIAKLFLRLRRYRNRWPRGVTMMQDVMAQWVINLPDCGVPATAKSGNLRYPSA